MACLLTLSACAGDTTEVATNAPVPDPDNGGIKLPAGFGGQIVADKVGRVRHIFVNSNGDLYAKLEKLKDGKGIVRLRDKNGDGKFDETVGFGNFIGTGMAIKNGYLYASSNTPPT
jgi:hypothetical protein